MYKRTILIGVLIAAFVLASLSVGYYLYKGRQPEEADRKQTVVIVNPGGVAFTKLFSGFEKEFKGLLAEKTAVVEVVYKDAEGDSEKLKALVSEAVSLKPDLIVTTTSAPAQQALKEGNETIPVLTVMGDPVAHGYVKSLQTPDVIVTGIAQQNIELEPKRFEILKKLVPSARRVAVFYDTGCAPTKKARPIANEMAPALGLTLTEFPLTSPSRKDLASALAKITRNEFDALMFYPHGTLFTKADIFLERALKEKLPIIMPDDTALPAGALASYGPSYSDMGKRMARQAVKVLSGISPKEIPFEQPDKIEFVISLTSARKLGVNVPPDVIGLADKVVR